MAKYYYGHTQGGVPCTQWPEIQREAAKLPFFTIVILDEDEAITDRQRRWYKGVCLKALSDWSGDTIDEWDYRLKTECGAEIFNMFRFKYKLKEFYRPESIMSKGKKQMTSFIENILSAAITLSWPIEPPDPELRKG
jgi:hypothetical protein